MNNLYLLQNALGLPLHPAPFDDSLTPDYVKGFGRSLMLSCEDRTFILYTPMSNVGVNELTQVKEYYKKLNLITVFDLTESSAVKKKHAILMAEVGFNLLFSTHFTHIFELTHWLHGSQEQKAVNG